MKCTLAPGIESMSGKCRGMLFKTFKRSNGKTETRAYLLPKNGGKLSHGVYKPTYGYAGRTKPLTQKESDAREKFTRMQERLNQLTPEQKQQFAKEGRVNKFKFNGKTYKTLRGYIAARLYAQDAD